MAESLLQQAERVGVTLAVRAVSSIRPMQQFPVTDPDGTIRYGHSVVSRFPISGSAANSLLRTHITEVAETLRPQLDTLLEAQPSASGKVRTLYVVGELLGVRAVQHPDVWSKMMAADWRGAASQIMVFSRPQYMEASPEIQAKVNDVIFDMAIGA